MCNVGNMLKGIQNFDDIVIPINKEQVGEIKCDHISGARINTSPSDNMYDKKYTFGQAMDLVLQGYIVKPNEPEKLPKIYVYALKGISADTADEYLVVCKGDYSVEPSTFRPLPNHFICTWSIVKKDEFIAKNFKTFSMQGKRMQPIKSSKVIWD